jgi:hypothetical protein
MPLMFRMVNSLGGELAVKKYTLKHLGKDNEENTEES